MKTDLDRQVHALARSIEEVDSSQRRTVDLMAALAGPIAVEEAARRGALRALATMQSNAVQCRAAKGDPLPAASADKDTSEPTPSPEAIRAFDEAGAIVTAGLRRKVWTEEDRLALEARLPLLDGTLREEVVRRVIQAANARQLDTTATHGQIF